MENFIIEYLTKNYYIHKSPVGNDGIYRFDTRNIINIPTNGMELVTEIKEIFSLTTGDVFNMIYTWSNGHDLNFYWKTNSGYTDIKHRYNTIPKPGHLPQSLHMKYLDLISKERVD
jgi:hypothetical protein